MSNLYKDLHLSGLDANKPTTAPAIIAELPGVFVLYYATDTKITYQWNPASAQWDSQATAQLVAAAGQTQGTATAITQRKAIVTAMVTATHNGVKLPAVSTGLEVEIANGAAGGVKVYPSTGNQIAAAATNAADSTNLAINKVNTYIGVSKTKWVVDRGA